MKETPGNRILEGEGRMGGDWLSLFVSWVPRSYELRGLNIRIRGYGKPLYLPLWMLMVLDPTFP